MTIILNSNQHADLMRFAFNQIADPNDWKGPIDCMVPWAVANVYMDAIRFMTATWTACEHVVHAENGMMVHLTSVGYRAGPAGC